MNGVGGVSAAHLRGGWQCRKSALTVITRSLALGEVAPGNTSRALRKELFIGTINGLVLAVLIGLLAFTWKGSLLPGIVAGTAMLLNQVLGAGVWIVRTRFETGTVRN